MDINNILKKIIERKYQEIRSQEDTSGIFYKITCFEGNAIGQIGEEFIKHLFKDLNIPIDDNRQVIHDEYDILSNGKKIEIKTARKGLNKNTFQFNGINPNYNHDYIVLVGLTPVSAHYLIIKGKSVYNHRNRKHYLTVNTKQKQLVSMNPGNAVNYKLTLTLKDLKPISEIEKEIKTLFA